jgi:polygalacturonase
VTRFGAVPDGKTLCTQAIQKAIEACAAAGGGMVVVPPGRYLTGALFLRSNLHLHLEMGATLLASQRFDDFPSIDGRWEGIERKTHSSLLTGLELENVTISGHGVLDGQAAPWRQAYLATREMRLKLGLPRQAENPPGAPLKWPRPRLINLLRCQGVHVSGLVLRDAPSYTIHLSYCQDAVVDAISVLKYEGEGVGPDGLIIDSCKQVRVVSSSFGSGGDGIGIKSGYNEDGWRIGIPSEEIAITNCTVFFSIGAGLALGSETAGGIKNVTISNCVISNCRYGIFIRSPRGRGGVVERVRVANLVLDHLSGTAVRISNYFDSVRGDGAKPTAGNPETDRSMVRPIVEGTPTFRDFELTGLTIGAAPEVASIEGLPERMIQGVRLQNVTAVRAKAGVTCTRAKDISLSNVRLGLLEQPAVSAHDVERLEVHRLSVSGRPPANGLIALENVTGAFIHGCDIADPSPTALRERGHNTNIQLLGNNGLPDRA